MDGMFIQQLARPGGAFYYFAWVLSVAVSIVLHELGHGWMALRLGDPTPRIQGRMVGNPLVHMGPFSIGALLLTGMAWGSMPIDPSRIKGRYGEAKVALAGPAMNVGLAIVGLAGATLWLRITGELPADNTPAKRGFDLLWIFSTLNLVLVIFNLMPVPPLDGSHILANLNRRYADFLTGPNAQAVGFVGFILVFIVMINLYSPISAATLEVISQLSGVYLELV